MSLSKIDLVDKKFSRSLFGCDRREVDQFLAEAAEALGRLAEEKLALADLVNVLEEKLAAYRSQEETLRGAVMTTQEMVEEIKGKAREEAKRIVGAAGEEAEALLAEAGTELKRLRKDISALAAQKARLEAGLREQIEAHARLLGASEPVFAPKKADPEGLGGDGFTFSEDV